MVKEIKHSLHTVGTEELKALKKVLRTNYLAEGPKVAEFENALARYINCRFAMAASSGTAALHYALLALGISHDDEVIVPDYTCRSVLNAVQYTGAKPVICDVDKRTFNLPAYAAKEKITYRTKAIIIAHMFGCPV
jgi:dTDP-4-amino-4,6-dideoxygalactose transaminase